MYLLFCSCSSLCQKGRECCYMSRPLLDRFLLTASLVKGKNNISPTNAAGLQWCKWDWDLLQVQSIDKSDPETRARDIHTLSSSRVLLVTWTHWSWCSYMPYSMKIKVEEKKQASGAPERAEFLCDSANYLLHCRIWVTHPLDLKVLRSLNEEQNENVQCVPTHLLVERTLTLSISSLWRCIIRFWS